MAKPRNVCIVGPSKSFLSGISYYAVRLANALSGSNNVSVVAIEKLVPGFLFPGRRRIGKSLAKLELSDDVPVIARVDYDSPRSWFNAFRTIKNHRVDVIIFQWWTASVAHMYIALKLLNMIAPRAKVIMEFHELVDQIEETNLPLRVYSQLMGGSVARGADAYVAHSNAEKEMLVGRYGLSRDDVHVIPHALYDQYLPMDKDEARRRLNFKEEHLVLFFGLVRRYKGVECLIDGFRGLSPSILNNSRLLIIGEIWDDRASILGKAGGADGDSRITIRDEYVPDEDIPLYFSAADLVVLPYTRASQSGVAHIAAAMGRPLIISDVGGLRDSMTGYEGAFFIPPSEPAAITRAISTVLGGEVKSFRSPDKTWDETARRYDALIERLKGE